MWLSSCVKLADVAHLVQHWTCDTKHSSTSHNKGAQILVEAKYTWHWLLQQMRFILHLLLLSLSVGFRVRFSVDGMLFSNAIENYPFSVTFAVIQMTTNIIKHFWIHVHLFRIKLNMLLVALTGNFTLKMLQHVQEAAWCPFSEMSPHARFFYLLLWTES